MKTLFLIIFLFTIILTADETKKLNVGMYKNSPKIFLDSNSKPSGFFVDILNDIAKKESWQLNYVTCEWKECLLMLERGELDIMPDVAYSSERQKHFLFSKEIVLPSWSVVFANKKSKISSILDLDKKKIALLKDSIQHEQIMEFINLFEIRPIFVFTKSFDESFSLVERHEVDAAIVNKHYGETNRDIFSLHETQILLNPAALKFAFAPLTDEGIINKIDFRVKELKKDKNSLYYTSMQKWLKTKEKFNIPAWLKKAFVFSLVTIAILLAVIIFFKYMLNLKTKEILEKSQKFKELEEQKTKDYKKILYALISMIEQRDSYTAGHSKRVARYSELMARDMGYNNEDCALIHRAATLHDIGKIATPDAILLKPDKLSVLEYELIKEHVNVGVGMLKDIPMFENISQIIKYHHEKYNGSGYPDGIAKDEIPPLSRIMMVADAFDAMTTNRIYKHKKSVENALEEIKSLSEIHFHPEVVESALRVLLDIDTTQDFNQKPTTAIEEQRFVYFYKDSVTDLYNVKHLESTLINEENQELFSKIIVVSLHKFDRYNKKHGWQNGNNKLFSFARLLEKLFKNELLFRVRANDFIVLSKENHITKEQEDEIEKFTKEGELEFDFFIYSIKENNINSYSDLEEFL